MPIKLNRKQKDAVQTASDKLSQWLVDELVAIGSRELLQLDSKVMLEKVVDSMIRGPYSVVQRIAQEAFESLMKSEEVKKQITAEVQKQLGEIGIEKIAEVFVSSVMRKLTPEYIDEILDSRGDY